jgi:hypothetical protein
VLGIATAIFLFGVLRSTAAVTGNQFGYAIDLGGPIVAAVLVVVGGYHFTKPSAENFPLTVRLRGSQPAGDMAKDAWIIVDLEGRRDRVQMSMLGEATVKSVPVKLRNTEVPISFESATFRIKSPKDAYLIPANDVIYLEVIPIVQAPAIGEAHADNPAIHPDFTTAYEVAPALGSPRWPPTLADDAYQAVYERAHVIWIKPLLRIFVLPLDSEKKLIRLKETSFATDPDLFDDERARQVFHTPAGKYPPHGGIAERWRKEPERWQWLGWREWHCRFRKQIYYQHFEHGTVFGVFRLHPTQDEGQIIVMLDDETWSSKSVTGNVPACGEVAEQF